MRVRRVGCAVATGAAAFGVLLASGAAANPVTCAVNASGGYVNCLTAGNPSWEEVAANHAAGTPYRFQLQRFATGDSWGWWQYADQAIHIIPLGLSGSITAQVDNRGTANPASYWVRLV